MAKRTSRIKKHHISLSALAMMLIIGAGSLMYQNTRAETCLLPLTLESPAAGAALSGPVTLQARYGAVGSTANLTTMPPVEFIMQGATTTVIGPGQTADGFIWSRGWTSSNYADGTYQMKARSLGGGCVSPVVTFTIRNHPTEATLLAAITPVTWSGSTNIETPFHVKLQHRDSTGVMRDVTSLAQYDWSTTLGTVRPAGSSARYYSGATAGTGHVRVRAVYEGLTTYIQSSVAVHPYTRATAPSTTASSPSPAPVTSTSPAARTATVTQPISQPLNPEVESCLTGIITKDRLTAVNAGQVTPTVAERLAAANCFAPRHIVPARLAPVDPVKLNNVPVAGVEDMQISSAKTVTEQSADGETKQAIQLSGKAAPNAPVFLYIFSEPLVLKTQADGEGNWSYSLENPLKPGRHEVFVVMQDGETFTRTAAFPIQVAQAAPSDENPQGSSLQLANDAVDFQLAMYLLVALVIIIGSVRLVFVIRRLRSRQSKASGAA